MTKPSIVWVPGSFALPEFYDNLLNPLREQGYDIHGIHKPSVGLEANKSRPGVLPTMYDDAAHIAKEVEKLADEGKDVVLFAHSYGGVPVTQSTKGLGKSERQKVGKKGGIVRLAYMTCLVPDLGQAAKDVLAANLSQEQQIDMKIDEQGWMVHEFPERTAAICLNHLSSEEGAGWIRRFPRHSSVSFVGELTYAGYKDIPVSYLVCEEDLCIPEQNQRLGIEVIERESGRKVDVTSIKGDHIPSLSGHLAEVNTWVIDVVAKSS